MGSNVNAEFTVSVHKTPRGVAKVTIDHKTILGDINEIVEDEQLVLNGQVIRAEQECRWDFDEMISDMKKLSSNYPGFLFTMTYDVPDYGEGKDVVYFYEGKSQQAKIIVAPFNEAEL